MPATTLNLTIEHGATYSLAVALGASTWDGQTASAKIYDRFGGSLLTTLTCSAIAASSVTVNLSAAQTGSLAIPAYIRDDLRKFDYGYWELLATSGGVVTRLREGTVKLSRQAAL